MVSWSFETLAQILAASLLTKHTRAAVRPSTIQWSHHHWSTWQNAKTGAWLPFLFI